MKTILLTPHPHRLSWLAVVLVWLLSLAPRTGQSQVYYGVSDAATTGMDQLRRTPLAGGAEQIIVNSNASYPTSPGSVAVDVANNRLLVLNSFNNALRIAAVDLTTDAVTTFLTPAAISGAANNTFSGQGIAVDNVNGFVYYGVSDGATTGLDQLRRVPLAGGAEQIVVTSNNANYPTAPGALAVDAANNRLLVLNTFNNALRIAAVNLTTNAVTTFLTPAAISGSTNNTFSGQGIAVDNVNGFVYYGVSDGATTGLDQLRRVPLAGGAEQIVVASNNANYPTAPGALALDVANKRLLVLNTFVNALRIAAVDLTTNAVTTFLTPAAINGSASSTFSGQGIAVAGPAPTTVASITTTTTSPTNASSITYTVTFGASVTGVTASNFSLSPTVTGASITSVSAGPSATYTVVVSTGTGNGTLQLNLANATGISPGISNTLPFAGPAITIDKTAPTVAISSSAGASGGSTPTTPIPFTVTFSESVTGFAAGDVTVTNGIITGNVVNGSGTTYTFTVTPTTAGTATTVSVPANVAQDAASNFNTAAPSAYSLTYTLPAVAPTVTTTSPATSITSSTATVGGTLTSGGGANLSSYGIVYVLGTGTPTLTSNTGQVQAGNASPGAFPASFSANLTSLTAGTQYTARAYATNSAGTSYGASVTFTTAAPTITLSPASPLPGGTVAAAYSQTLTASGGTAPYTFAITAGALPAGLSLSSAGVLSGTPTAGGSFSFTVRATDASASPGPFSGTQNYSLTIGAPTISVAPATLPNGAVAAAYSQTLTGSGGTAPYSFAITAGALPAGLSLSSAGVLSGTPTAGGTFTFTIRATDSSTGTGAPYAGSRAYTLIIVAPAITVAPATLPDGAAGTAYSQTLTGSGGTAPYSFAITAGAPPAGLSLAPNGTLSGTPTTSGTFNFTIAATDASTGNGPYSGSRAYSLTIAPPAALAITPVTLPNGTVAVAYSQAITASGGTAPYTYAITAGALPAGLSLTAGGVLAGTPTAGGSFTFTITATDAATGTASTGVRSYTLTIAAPTITVAPTALPNGAVGTAYSQTITGSGGTAPYTYAITAGTLPAGLNLTAGGVLSGVPTASGTFNFTVRATDASTGSGPYSGSRAYSLTIAAPTITVAPATLPGGTVGAAYSQTLTASGGLAPYSYAITAGALPAGLTLSSGGVLSGVPTTGGSFSFTITARDAAAAPGPYSGAQAYTLTIAAPTVVVNPTTLPAGTLASAYSQTLTASGGTAPYSFAVTAGALPTGLALALNGTLSGTPTAASSFTFTITATDASTGTGAPYTGSRSYTVSIAPPTNTTWTGTISPDWFTAGNWSPNVVPTASTSATIPANAVFQPVINSGTATTLNLTLNSGATLTMSDGTLDVRGNLTNNGTFTPTGGMVVLGTTFQSNGPNILGSSRVRFWNLTVNANGVLLSTSAGASVRRLLTLNGAFVTQGNAFVLESDASGTAMVVNSSSAGFVFGSATVQRYIDASGNTGTSGYRHYSSPVGLATVSSLSTSAYGGSFTAQVNAAYNTQDPNTLTLATYPNVFSYDESKIATSPAVSFSDFDKGYQSPASLNDPLTAGRGYAVQIGNTEKVQFTGPLNNNTQVINGLTYAAANTSGAASAGWALVGNPYPAPLDWRTVGTAAGSSLNGVDGAAYVFQSTSAYSGRYTSFTNNVGASTGLIAVGQGFFVHASTPGTTGSITLTNANRVTSYANPAFQRTTAETRPLLRLSLGLGNQPATVATAQDETFLYFEAGATNGVDGKYDAYKLANPSGYYLGSVTPSSSPVGLSIDGRAPLAVATTTEIPLWVSVPAGTYSLTATELLNFATLAGGTTVQLRDALLGTLTDLATVPSYSFSVAANAAYAGRFSLVFRTSGVLATLPGTALALAKTSLYPNPATSATALSVTDLPKAVTSLQVEVVDVLGRVVGQYTLPVRSGSAHQQLATDQLASTLYLLRLTALDAQGLVQGTLPTQRLTLSH
ncbi:MAG: putative Ig domain-containing protein [Janthinobacterium lividum]